MKPKNIKYPLIVGVSLVWGLVIFKVVKGIGNKETVEPMVSLQKKIDYNQPVDSFALLADYLDPFIPKEENSKNEDAGNQSTKNDNLVAVVTAAATPKPVFDPTIIQYTGMISNPDRKMKVAILSIAGKEYLTKENERIEGYTIKQISKYKTVIIYKGVSYAIQINQ